ncbi:MAG: HNH endonuclease [Nitrososphaerales archaeon]
MNFEDFDLHSLGNTIQPVGAVYAGNGDVFITLFPEEDDVYRDGDELAFIEMNLDQWQKFLRQLDLVETEVLAQAKDGSIVKAFIRKTARNIEGSISWAVYRRDNYKCRYCGKDDVPLTVDHIITWENGGPSTEENLVSACEKCNRTRGSTAYSEWLRSSYYKGLSKNLSSATKRANEALIEKLAHIPLKQHRRSR